MKLLCLAIATALLCGCASQKIQTASGRPEVTITGSTTERIRGDIANTVIDRGYQPRNSDAMALVFEKTSDSVLEQFAYSSNYDVNVVKRLRVNIIEIAPGNHRVVATLAAITNPGSGFERANDMTRGKTAQQLQEMLNQVKGRTEGVK